MIVPQFHPNSSSRYRSSIFAHISKEKNHSVQTSIKSPYSQLINFFDSDFFLTVFAKFCVPCACGNFKFFFALDTALDVPVIFIWASTMSEFRVSEEDFLFVAQNQSFVPGHIVNFSFNQSASRRLWELKEVYRLDRDTTENKKIKTHFRWISISSSSCNVSRCITHSRCT